MRSNFSKFILVASCLSFLGFSVIFLIRHATGVYPAGEIPGLRRLGPDHYQFLLGANSATVQKTDANSFQATIYSHSNQTAISVGYHSPEEKLTLETRPGQVVYKGNLEEIRYYIPTLPVPSPSPVSEFQTAFRRLSSGFSSVAGSAAKNITAAAAGTSLKFINWGSLDTLSFAALYDHYLNHPPLQPTLSYFTPSDNTFVFYGYRPAAMDLEISRTLYPLVRFRTALNHTCPVIYGNREGVMVFTLHHPQLWENGSEPAIRVIESAIADTLSPLGIKLERVGHLFYYRDQGLPKQIGRIAVDKSALIFYLYLTPPTDNPDFYSSSLQYLKIRDGILVPFTGLTAINRQAGPHLAGQFASLLAAKLRLSLDSTLPDSQLRQQVSLASALNRDASWLLHGYRPDIGQFSSAAHQKFEIELILHSRPNRNVFEFPIQSDGLEFIRQPELTLDQREKGTYRDENLIGSYAVYYRSSGVSLNGRSAKAYHIFRPRIADSQGNTIWGQLEYHPDTSSLTVTVPWEFLNSAAYPVSIDPTFGFSEPQESYYSITADSIQGSVFTMGPVSGTGTSVTAGISCSKATTLKAGLYLASDGSFVPNSGTEEKSVGVGSSVTFNFLTPPALEADTDYVIVLWSKGPQSCSMSHDTGTANQAYYSSATYASDFPASPSFTHDNLKFVLYVTYTESNASVQLNGVNLQGVNIN